MNSSAPWAGSGTFTFEEVKPASAAQPIATTPASPVASPSYASFFLRLAAHITDNIIVWIGVWLTLRGAAAGVHLFKGVDLAGDLRFILAGIGFYFLFYLVYFVYFLTHGGQTPGKKMLGIKVVAVDGGEVDGLRALFRAGGYAFSWAFFGMGYLWAAIDRDHQAWHDKFAGTVVLEI